MSVARHNPNQPPPVAPKFRKDVKHWSHLVSECVVSADPEEGFGNSISISGGADNGLFCFITDIKFDHLSTHSGHLNNDEILLEVQGQKIAGFTLRDANAWLKQVGQSGAPVMIKTVKIGLLPKDLRQYLTTRFQKGSIDHDLQQTIRDNLYLRTVPCTTRAPKPGEKNGVDYTFLSVEEFQELERNGCLLESGIYYGNHYGTPKPPKDPSMGPVKRSGSIGNVLLGGSSNRNRNSGSSVSSPIHFHGDSPSPTGPPPHRKKSIDKSMSEGNLGPLPHNWEIAFTEDGQQYFIDHNTENTHWLDPRLARLQKQSAEDCQDDGRHLSLTLDRVRRYPKLPFGWEKVEDPHFGTYYIDHVNRRTQYENPVSALKKQGYDVNTTLPRTKKSLDQAKRSISDSNMNSRGAPPEYAGRRLITRRIRGEKRVFTKNPDDLKGEIIKTSLVKSVRGLGFTIIGGDHADEEFLQIKKVVENGPAHLDGVLQTGDVLVRVDGKNVLGYTHQDIVNLFQTIPPQQQVQLEVCRGYCLPFDPDDPNTEIIVTVAVNMPGDRPGNQAPSYAHATEAFPSDNLDTSAKSLSSLPDLAQSAKTNSGSIPQSNSNHSVNENAPDVLSQFSGKSEILSMNIVRGERGFGFTIADSTYGQKVKQILNKDGCKILQEGDILLEINGTNVKDMSHNEIVQVLKECPEGRETKIVVQRGGIPLKKKQVKQNVPPADDSSGFSGSQLMTGAYILNDTDKFSSRQTPVTEPRDHTTDKENQDMVDGAWTRSKTPTGNEPKQFNDARPKTPTRTMGLSLDNHVGPKPSTAGRHPFSDVQNSRYLPDDREPMELNQSQSSSEFVSYPGSADFNGRPPPGLRFDNNMHRNFSNRPEVGRPNHSMHNSSYPNQRDFEKTEAVKPGMMRSRTPGPEMFRGNGSDFKHDVNRPKTPTASDLRSKTPNPSSMGYGYRANDFRYNDYTNMNGPSRTGNSRPQWGQPNHMDYPGSPPPVRRGPGMPDFDIRNYSNGVGIFPQQQQQGGAGRPPKHSTSFEDTDFSRGPRKYFHTSSSFHNQPSPINQSPRIPPRFVDPDERYMELTVSLTRQQSGFGFRIIGGTEEGSQVSVGHIVPGGSADLDGRLRTGDEITHINNYSVVNCSHHQVIQLMNKAGASGQVTLSIRRHIQSYGDYSSPGRDIYPYDVKVTRRPTEGFGFVIISSVNKSGSVIGKILENSPAERCGHLHVGDRILAVNNIDISHLHHEDIVNIIKEAGFSVTLTVGSPQDDSSSSTSNSNRGSQGSMVNAMAFPAPGEDMRRHMPPERLKEMNRQASFPNQGNSEAEEYIVELPRSYRGFGFSIRGGREFNNMPLFVLRIAECGSADIDGRLRVGDQILEINGLKTDNMTHSEAIDIIQNGGQTVLLRVKRTGKLPPSFDPNPLPPGPGRYGNQPVTNGPIGQSSPYLGRRNMDHHEDQKMFNYQGGRQFSNY